MEVTEQSKYQTALQHTENEVLRSRTKFRKMASPHEGYAVILEELDELWEVVKEHQNNPGRLDRAYKEAIQVAAMAICFMVECCEHDNQILPEQETQ